MNKKRFAVHILFIVIAIAIEIFICNIRTFQSLFYAERDISEYPVQIDRAELLPNGDWEINGESAVVSVFINDEKINNIFMDVETLDDSDLSTENGVCEFTLYIQDELISGGESKTRSVVQRKLHHNVEASKYVFFESFGNAKLVQLELKPQSGNILRIHGIKLNAHKPIIFSFARVALFIILSEILFIFRPSSWTWKRRALAQGKHGNVILCIFYAGFILIMFVLMIKNPPMWHDGFNPYANYAKALAEGHLYVGKVDPEIASYEGKMLSWAQNDERIMFDHALYNGKYYVYFGVLPVLAAYLPYYLITGGNLPDAAVMLLIAVLLIPGVYFLLREIIRRLSPDLPFAMHLIMTVAVVLGAGLPVLLGGTQIYSVAILSGVLLSVWGIYFFLRSFPFMKHPGLLFCGSCCMALVAACRPTLLLYSLIIVPLGYFSYKEHIRAGINKGKILRTSLSIAIPYIVVGACLMYYNWVRFESPFQFGMIYNMTNIPSNNPAVDVPEMIILGFYEYLFKPIEFEHLFPFIKGHYDACVKEYSGTIYYYRTQGFGLLMYNPILLILFVAPFLRTKKQKLINILLLSALALTTFYICFDTYITQWITTRYSLEFSLFLFFVADIVWLIIWKRDDSGRNNIMIWIFVAVNLISALVNLLAFFNAPVYPLNLGNAEFFYDIFYTWHYL